MTYRLVGRHSGKNKILKIAGLLYRALQLIPVVLREKPNLSLSVCSRAQLLACAALGAPTVVMGDYEYATGWSVVRPSYLLCPEVIPTSMLKLHPDQVWKYPGIKEDVYVPQFVPELGIRQQLGLREEDLVVTVRPPASEAHYHNPHSDELFEAAVEFLAMNPDVRLVALPRNESQADVLRAHWPEYFASGKMRIPRSVVDGLNLIWHSDFVVSAGGTMNREAAALGVPVYSAFGGQIGAVDRYLIQQGRLVLLECVADVEKKISVVRRARPAKPDEKDARILRGLVQQIAAIADAQRRKLPRPSGRAAQQG
ncbi:MAG: DUF354 domain-containing protein [Acidobacteria bacterium]|nr:DUF354 domain-containing protein [Acidobacteriota bacterium]